MKKILIILSLIIMVLGGCAIKQENDSYKFKNEYESLNNTQKGENTIRTVNIPADNPFVYKTPEDIILNMENKETFLVYFGFASCPWCRSVLSNLIDAAKYNSIETIYYVDITGIRDVLSYNEEKNQIVIDEKGTEPYFQLLTLFNDVLEDYKIYDDNNELIETKEKRIYAPNIIAVVDGKPVALTNGISDKQNDPYMELTEAINKDSYKKISKVISKLSDSGVCEKGKGC